MMRGVFQATIVDDSGSVLPSCNIEVTLEADGSSPQLYDAITAGSTLGNPFTADAGGFARLYVEEGLYRVRAYTGSFERIWRHVVVTSGAEAGSYTGTVVGVTTVVTGDISWRKSGNKVTLYRTGALQGTSNTTEMQLTGMPANLRPTATQYVVCAKLMDASVPNVIGTCSITSSGDIGFNTISGSVNPSRAGGFTASGTKGLVSGWSISYDIS